MNAGEMTNRVQDLQRRATEKAKDLSTRADHYVRENTWATIGVAILVGWFVGYMLSGRRD